MGAGTQALLGPVFVLVKLTNQGQQMGFGGVEVAAEFCDFSAEFSASERVDSMGFSTIWMAADTVPSGRF